MYRIREDEVREKKIMLIPAMLDAHFPLLKYAFYSPDYHPIILENEENITNVGLHYVNNDMCYPAILNIGQMVSALQSGRYDLDRTVLLMPQAGDACRGSNYVSALRRAVKKAGVEVPVLSLNVKGLEKQSCVRLHWYMVWRALVAVVYEDLLMILTNQVRPYELHPGDTTQCLNRWQNKLAEELRSGRHIGIRSVKRNIRKITEEYAKISRDSTRRCRKIGIVGELYMKYCHIGNWNLQKFLEEQHCEYYVNGLLWYALYYIDTHLKTEPYLIGKGYQLVYHIVHKIQCDLIAEVRAHGFYIMDEFHQFKKHADGLVPFHCTVGDGWLIGAECVNHDLGGFHKVIANQPFGCMPNQVCGKGLYPSLNCEIGTLNITSIDYDSGASSMNVRNRVMMAIGKEEW